MIALFGCITLLLLSLLIASLRPIYSATPQKELNRRVKKGDRRAKAIRAVSEYGNAADVFLSALVIILSSVAFTLIVLQTNKWLAPAIIAIVSFVLFYVLPYCKFALSKHIAIVISPYLAGVLKRISPFIYHKNNPAHPQDLYEKDDLIELLQAQKTAADNRIEASELELAKHVLTFGDKKVIDYMIPRDDVRTVSSEEPIGPILLTELYDSGFTRFPVHNQKDDTIVGTLFLKDLVEKRTTGIVSNVMNSAVFYVNSQAPLEQVLAAFTKTKHHLFIVVNDAVEVMGIITIEDVLEQVLGRTLTDEFDNYDDIQQVAAHSSIKTKKSE